VELGLTAGTASLALKVRNGTPPFAWYANGAPIGREPHTRSTRWHPDGPGFATIAVVDARGQSSRVTVFLD
jgi:penicillin-binding protein 1C